MLLSSLFWSTLMFVIHNPQPEMTADKRSCHGRFGCRSLVLWTDCRSFGSPRGPQDSRDPWGCSPPPPPPPPSAKKKKASTSWRPTDMAKALVVHARVPSRRRVGYAEWEEPAVAIEDGSCDNNAVSRWGPAVTVPGGGDSYKRGKRRGGLGCRPFSAGAFERRAHCLGCSRQAQHATRLLLLGGKYAL